MTVAFLSTLSLRRATLKPPIKPHRQEHFYPRSPCGERRSARPETRQHDAISIHALLAESDETFIILTKQLNNFYPRSPCGERLLVLVSMICLPPDFYPRSPCGERLDSIIDIINNVIDHFYPRSPCGERQANAVDQILPGHISIHALLAESDKSGTQADPVKSISIHALLAESDKARSERINRDIAFLSTLSLRRATAKVHKTMGHFCTYETNFMGIASSC